MPTVLNNTQRNFDAFTAPIAGSAGLTRTTVVPGFNTLTEEQLKNMKSDSHFMRAVSQDAVILGGNKTDIRESEVKPLEKVPESPKKRLEEEGQPLEVTFENVARPARKKKGRAASSDFGDFE